MQSYFLFENNRENVMVKLLTIAVFTLFSNSIAMADSLPGTHYPHLSYKKDGAAPEKSANPPPPLRFQMTHDYIGSRWTVSKDLLLPQFSSQTAENTQPGELGHLQQHDAALLYPISKKGMNFDLGLNLRLINGQTGSYGADTQSRNFNKAIPMFYAAALFDLPFKGLSAGFVGRHSDSLLNPSFDYKAKLSYQWAGGLGLEGGWQHQQYANDELNQLQSNPVSKGLFLDLHLSF